jgi:hypothetical protein
LRDWELYTRDGEPEAGYEFPTPVGRIDLLARHRREPRWLVIELKRDKSSDAVVGQILRYIGWISAHYVQPGETVEGLVIATHGEDKLHYALSAVPAVSFKSYEVEFRLNDGRCSKSSRVLSTWYARLILPADRRGDRSGCNPQLFRAGAQNERQLLGSALGRSNGRLRARSCRFILTSRSAAYPVIANAQSATRFFRVRQTRGNLSKTTLTCAKKRRHEVWYFRYRRTAA